MCAQIPCRRQLKPHKVPEDAWINCNSAGDVNQCFLDAMQQSTSDGKCTTDDEAMADNTDPSITSACACDR